MKNSVSVDCFIYYNNVAVLNICQFPKAVVITNFYNWNRESRVEILALSRSQLQNEEIDTHCIGTGLSLKKLN